MARSVGELAETIAASISERTRVSEPPLLAAMYASRTRFHTESLPCLRAALLQRDAAPSSLASKETAVHARSSTGSRLPASKACSMASDNGAIAVSVGFVFRPTSAAGQCGPSIAKASAAAIRAADVSFGKARSQCLALPAAAASQLLPSGSWGLPRTPGTLRYANTALPQVCRRSESNGTPVP